jgi:serine/threonine protein kinase
MFRRDADLPGVEIMLGDFGVAHLPDATGQAAVAGVAPDASGPNPLGIPKPADATAVTKSTGKKEAVGTLAYMAPEQRRGEVSPASDIYASAVVLFEMLTGRTPGGREGVIGGRRQAADFRLPAELFTEAPSVAADVQAHLDHISEGDPAKRPTTMQALAESQRLRERVIAAGAS